MTGVDRDRPWSRLHLALFRFVFGFIALYTLDLVGLFFQRQQGPPSNSFTAPIWHPLVLWIGHHLLHLAHPASGQGLVGQDAPYEYILRGTELLLALVAAVAWSFLDRSRRDYRNLNAYLRVFVRTFLATEMLVYGLAKVPPSQFGVLSLVRQAQPLGQMGPMAVLWAFMAASPGYTLLCGLVEVAGGVLLLTRRTATLGALIALGAMTNVLVLNIFYDVNQKIRCVYYVLLALFLAAPQLPGLWRLLVSQRPAGAAPEPKLLGPRPLRIALSCLPLVFAILSMIHFVPADVHRYRMGRLKDASRGPNYGIWRVDSFIVGDPQKPLLSQKSMQEFGLLPGHDRWYQVILDAGNQVEIELENGRYNHVEASHDKATGDTILSDPGDKQWQARLHFERKSPTSLLATGTVSSNPVAVVLTRQGDGKNHPADAPRWISDGRRW